VIEIGSILAGAARAALGLSIVVAAIAIVPAEAGTLPEHEAWRLIDDLDSPDPSIRARARGAIVESGDRTIAPALAEVIFFSRNGRDDANAILEALLHERIVPGPRSHGYREWLEVIGRHEEIAPKNGYVAYKSRQYARIDPAFAAWIAPGVPSTIRMDEIVFGGVRKDAIPALTLPAHVAASGVTWLADGDTVYGAVVGGESRAWPGAIVASHEIVNDVVGGRAVTLAFCTLCGAPILYDASPREHGTFTFGTSGLLYRSNKLMYDRQTNSLWSQLSGKPVVGPLVGKGLSLEVLPLVTTTWGDWKRAHPETTLMSNETGYRRNYDAPYAEYFASPEVIFPVWKRDDALELKDRIWILVVNAVEKAYPLDVVFDLGVVNDAIGATNVVLIGDRTTGSVRAWDRGERRFANGPDGVSDQDGMRYRVSDENLVSEDGSVVLRLLPGHEAYWFGWVASIDQPDLYGDDE